MHGLVEKPVQNRHIITALWPEKKHYYKFLRTAKTKQEFTQH